MLRLKDYKREWYIGIGQNSSCGEKSRRTHSGYPDQEFLRFYPREDAVIHAVYLKRILIAIINDFGCIPRVDFAYLLSEEDACNMPPSPISIVRNLPHHLWSRLPLCSTKRSPIVRFAPSRLLSISSIRNQSPSTTSSAKPEDLPIPYLKDGLGSSDGANHLHDELKRMLDEKDGSISDF